GVYAVDDPESRMFSLHHNRTQPTRRRVLGAASGFATSRAHAIKSCANGLSMRFFNVMIPTVRKMLNELIGNTLSGKCLLRRTADIGSMVINPLLTTKCWHSGSEYVTTM